MKIKALIKRLSVSLKRIPSAPEVSNVYEEVLDSFKHKFHILIPVFNFEAYLQECLDSILSQNYKNYVCYLFDDGSTDKSVLIYQKYSAEHPDKFVIIRNETNGGPAFSKYQGIQKIKKCSAPNDIFLIVDGDDCLKNKNALNIINETYLNTKCWFTYGNCVGQWCDQGAPPPTNNFRMEKWRYTQPRSLKCGLLSLFVESDFKINGAWLKKGTDRPIIFNCLEWSGPKKIQFIDVPIYAYRTHDANTIKVLDSHTIKTHKEHVNNQPPKSQIADKIDVVMCSWDRIHNIPGIIDSLDNQTVSKQIHFHIINNNPEYRDAFEGVKSKNIDLTVSHRNQNGFGYERFLYTQLLRQTRIVDYVIFVDDDQYFENDYIEELYSLREPKTLVTGFGKTFDKSRINYWQKPNLKLDRFDYGGTCGCILDTNIFSGDSCLWDISSVEKQFVVRKMEDIWLSYCLSQYEWKIKNCFKRPFEFKDKSTKEASLWLSLIDEKQEFTEHLIIQQKWKLLSG